MTQILRMPVRRPMLRPAQAVLLAVQPALLFARPLLLAMFLAGLLAGAVPACAATLTLRETPAEVYFSPKGGAEAAIVRSIAAARQEVCVLAFGFTSTPIADALIAAGQRGVRVRVILDKSHRTEKPSKMQRMLDGGLPVRIDSAHRIAHNKVMIIDRHRLITGSYNFNKSAEESNSENVLILDSPALSQVYLQDFEQHAAHGEDPATP